MSDPVEPPEVAAWKAVRNADGCWDDIVNHQVTAGDALAAALVAAREEVDRLLRWYAEAEFPVPSWLRSEEPMP